MDENVIEIKKQVRKIIELLEQRIILEPNRPILKTLYDRYMKAEEIISSNEDISKIMISGGCRAYLDAFSDYMNPLLGEMDKAEKMLSNLKSSVERGCLVIYMFILSDSQQPITPARLIINHHGCPEAIKNP